MELLICHLIGDFVLQSHTMAVHKTSMWRWAIIHAAFYSIPFAVLLCLTASIGNAIAALAVIGGTHAIIDRLGVAGMWCRFYGVGHPGVWWRFSPHYRTESFTAPPTFLAVWLTIIVDNTLHLSINAAAYTLATG